MTSEDHRYLIPDLVPRNIPAHPIHHTAGGLDDATVGGNLRFETGALSRGEVVHATVVAVVHVVVETDDRIA